MRRRELLSESKIPTLTLSKSSVSTSWTSGSTTFDVLADGVKYTNDSNVNVTSSQSWATTKLSSGTVTVSYTTNTSTSSTRNATISVSLFGQTKQFTLKQNKDTTRGVIGDRTYVDLNLPSGLLWDTKDVGASNENTPGTILYNFDVVLAAAGSLGNGWRVPTSAETDELRTTAASTSGVVDGNKAILFVRNGGQLKFINYNLNGVDVHWWTKTSRDLANAWAFRIYNNILNIVMQKKSYEFRVRCVHDPIT